MGALTNRGAEWYVNLQTGKRNVDFPHLLHSHTLVPEVFLDFPRVRELQSDECESRSGEKEKPLFFLAASRLSRAGKIKKNLWDQGSTPKILAHNTLNNFARRLLVGESWDIQH